MARLRTRHVAPAAAPLRPRPPNGNSSAWKHPAAMQAALYSRNYQGARPLGTVPVSQYGVTTDSQIVLSDNQTIFTDWN